MSKARDLFAEWANGPKPAEPAEEVPAEEIPMYPVIHDGGEIAMPDLRKPADKFAEWFNTAPFN